MLARPLIVKIFEIASRDSDPFLRSRPLPKIHGERQRETDKERAVGYLRPFLFQLESCPKFTIIRPADHYICNTRENKYRYKRENKYRYKRYLQDWGSMSKLI